MLLFTRGLRQVLRARLRTGTGYRNDAKFQVRLDIRKLVRYGSPHPLVRQSHYLNRRG